MFMPPVKPSRAVDDENFAVVAQVGIMQTAGNQRWQEGIEKRTLCCRSSRLIEGNV